MSERPPGSARHLDWAAIKQRLPTRLGFEESEADLERIFAERAVELARVERDEGEATRSPYLVFRIGEARFALALSELRTILNPRTLTKIPCAPEHLSQMTHAEGRIVPLVDLAVVLQLAHGPRTGKTAFFVVVLDSPKSPLGVLVDRVEGMAMFDASEVGTAVRSGPGSEFLRGVTSDMVLVISGDGLIETVKKLARAPHAVGVGTQEAS